MSVFKCKMCGGTIELEEGASVGICDSCSTKQTLPKTNDEIVANLFNRANNLRLKCEFDRAAEIYESIVREDDSEAEAHWGIVLCKYGIEYVDDPKTKMKIPTCHRTLFDAVTKDPDYQAAIDYSDTLQQMFYEKEAKEIDRIQRDILAIVRNEKPFDVFICYKETDESGKRTIDSSIANDIYHQLTQEGYKVFCAAITLENKIGQEYEPYIFAALNSAKVMLALGTKPEYFNAAWVKNEWYRFMQLMKTDRSKFLIPCYRDMDAYDLPEEFAHLQAQDMGKIGFINDVVRGIRKVIVKDEPKTVKETIVVNNTPPQSNIAPLLERAYIFLDDGNWSKADEYCEQVLNQDPKNAKAYLCKLLAEKKVHNQADLKSCAKPFDESTNYKNAVHFSDPSQANSLKVLAKQCRENIEKRHNAAVISRKRKVTKYLSEFILLLTIILTIVFAVESNKKSNYEVEKNPDGTCTIIRYHGSKSKVRIPKRIGGRKVTIIGMSVFRLHNNITEIIIPEGVTCIEGGLFGGSNNLEKITIPSSITDIHVYCMLEFAESNSLKITFKGTKAEWRVFQNKPLLANLDTVNYIVYCKDGIID